MPTHSAAIRRTKLPVVFTTGEDGYIVAEVPVLPGCISQGKSREEALANVREAAELCLESAAEEGWQPPVDFTMGEVEVGA
jgi:predicted RNase H-like HicB family nuclease